MLSQPINSEVDDMSTHTHTHRISDDVKLIQNVNKLGTCPDFTASNDGRPLSG